jgi:hypothetical protein
MTKVITITGLEMITANNEQVNFAQGVVSTIIFVDPVLWR